jgi:hypothetical protein
LFTHTHTHTHTHCTRAVYNKSIALQHGISLFLVEIGAVFLLKNMTTARVAVTLALRSIFIHSKKPAVLVALLKTAAFFCFNELAHQHINLKPLTSNRK